MSPKDSDLLRQCLAMLRAVEFAKEELEGSEYSGVMIPMCPVCEVSHSHHSECEMDALIKSLKTRVGS